MRTQLLKHSMSLQEFLCLCPRFSGQHHDKLVEYRQEGLSCRFIPEVMQGSGWQQRLHVVEKARSSQLCQHPLLCLSPRDLHVGSFQIEIETFKQALSIKVFENLQRMGKVKEVAPLFPLQHRAQFCRQHLFGCKRHDLCRTSEPGILDAKGHAARRVVWRGSSVTGSSRTTEAFSTRRQDA